MDIVISGVLENEIIVKSTFLTEADPSVFKEMYEEADTIMIFHSVNSTMNRVVVISRDMLLIHNFKEIYVELFMMAETAKKKLFSTHICSQLSNSESIAFLHVFFCTFISHFLVNQILDLFI